VKSKLNYNEIENKFEFTLKQLGNKYNELGSGAYRTTFALDGKKVVKCPNTEYTGADETDNGVIANLLEFYISKKYAHLKIFPRVKLVWLNGIPLVIMDKLDEDFSTDRRDKFFDILEKNEIELWDGDYQCGMNSRGRVLCYDFGNEFDLVSKVELKKIKNRAVGVYEELSKIKLKWTKK